MAAADVRCDVGEDGGRRGREGDECGGGVGLAVQPDQVDGGGVDWAVEGRGPVCPCPVVLKSAWYRQRAKSPPWAVETSTQTCTHLHPSKSGERKIELTYRSGHG